MDRFIGLDAHAQSCTIVVVNQKSKHLRTDGVETKGESLVEYLRLVPGRRHVCLEEGTPSPWLSKAIPLRR